MQTKEEAMDPKSVMYICEIHYPQTRALHIGGLLKHNLHAAEVDLFSKQFSAHHYVTTIPIKMLSIFITLSPKFPSYFLFAVNPQAPDNHQSVFCSYGFVL